MPRPRSSFRKGAGTRQGRRGRAGPGLCGLFPSPPSADQSRKFAWQPWWKGLNHKWTRFLRCWYIQPPLSPFRRSVNPSGANDRAAFTCALRAHKGSGRLAAIWPQTQRPGCRVHRTARSCAARSVSPKPASSKNHSSITTIIPQFSKESTLWKDMFKETWEEERAKEAHHWLTSPWPTTYSGNVRPPPPPPPDGFELLSRPLHATLQLNRSLNRNIPQRLFTH